MKLDKAPLSERETTLTVGITTLFRGGLLTPRLQTYVIRERFLLAATSGAIIANRDVPKEQAEPWMTPPLSLPSGGSFSDIVHILATDGSNLLPYFNTDNRP